MRTIQNHIEAITRRGKTKEALPSEKPGKNTEKRGRKRRKRKRADWEEVRMRRKREGRGKRKT